MNKILYRIVWLITGNRLGFIHQTVQGHMQKHCEQLVELLQKGIT
jgi:hypothetical protein